MQKEKEERNMELMEESKEETLPPGFRFHPTDEELITCYLINKISDSSFTGKAITDINLNKSEPWELPGKAKMGEKEWYFFSMRDRKYPTGVRTNRATNSGYWKTTGKDREIFNSVTSELVGMKKTLVFYKGRAPRGEKSNWVMHEYRIHSKSTFRTNKQEEWVVCRIFKKSGSGKKYPCNSNSNHTRAGSMNPYSMQEIGSSNMVQIPPQMMQYYLQGLHGDPATPHFLYGRNNSNYINGSNAEVLRGGIIQSHQMNYSSILPATTGEEGGGFSISGLNLNLGSGGGATTTTQPILRPMQHSQYAMADNVSSINMNMNSVGADQNINNFVGYNGMEHCMDLETYWPNSY
ncbi:unnamed protein product [Trifolium pratense]|uniref:Uncharacterized protein n=1 Tax=Trifolium pratense TaxID=57577 RepID=A0ACB0JH30_TRIPR|nr:unnamed protein product [Trifolium pratense]